MLLLLSQMAGPLWRQVPWGPEALPTCSRHQPSSSSTCRCSHTGMQGPSSPKTVVNLSLLTRVWFCMGRDFFPLKGLYENFLTLSLRFLVRVGEFNGWRYCAFSLSVSKMYVISTFQRSVYLDASADVSQWYYSSLPKKYQQNFLYFLLLELCSVYLHP